MLRCYVRDVQLDWDYYVQVLSYPYNNGIHSSTNHTPFGLVLSLKPSELGISGDSDEARRRV